MIGFATQHDQFSDGIGDVEAGQLVKIEAERYANQLMEFGRLKPVSMPVLEKNGGAAKCDGCPKEFISRRALDGHRRRVHGER